MARVAGVDIPDNKRINIALTYILGIGNGVALDILDKVEVAGDVYPKVKDLSEQELNKIREIVEKEYMVARSMKSFLINKYGADFWMGDRLIDYMLYWGKFHFVLKSIIPNYHDTLSFGYTKKELDWCYSNEKRIWKYFLDEEKEGSSILFSSSTEYFYKYIKYEFESNEIPISRH